MDEAYVTAVELRPDSEGNPGSAYPWNLPVVASLAQRIKLDPRVTYLVGENGSGKSTLLEAIAVAAGMNAEGGSSNFAFSTRESHSELWKALRLVRGVHRPATDFFLRAESVFTASTYLEGLADEPLAGNPFAPYGGKSLHEQSHGESFLAVMINRFDPNGFYLLDEPEAALSTQNCLTHSPIILAYPNATIYSCSGSGLEEISYEDADPVRLTTGFLQARERFLHQLFSD